jgi:hypothetical protein
MTEINAQITMRQAARLAGYHPDYLSSLIRSGQLQGQKFSKTWGRFCEGNPHAEGYADAMRCEH